MDEALKKSGEYPNIAMPPGKRVHAATGEAVEIPASARVDNGTCEDVGTAAIFKCSMCGWQSNVFTFGEGMPCFCPNCGRKVSEE